MKQILSEEFRRMQKLAGIITESQYKWEDNISNIIESISEVTLTPDQEKEIIDDIIKTLNEGEEFFEKIINYAKKGMITLGIISALLGNAPDSMAKSKILDIVRTEAPYISPTEIDKLADTNKSNSSNDIGIMLNTSLKSTQPYVIKSKDFIDDIPFTSWNYGAHAGKSNATTGLSISYSKGDDIIKIAISPVSGQSADGYNSIIKSAKESGFKQVTKGDFEAPTSQSRKVVDFVKTSLPQLK
jgi:hypothetical protein